MSSKRPTSGTPARGNSSGNSAEPRVDPESIDAEAMLAKIQSASKNEDEPPDEYPKPAGPTEVDRILGMLKSAETSDEARNLLAAEIDQACKGGDVEARRATFFLMDELNTPKACFVGRHLHDKRTLTNNDRFDIVDGSEVYGDIKNKAPHLISTTAEKHLAHAAAPRSATESSLAASYFIKNIYRRLKVLIKLDYLEKKDKRYRLSELGRAIFHRWPWWSFRHDEKKPSTKAEPEPRPAPDKPKPP